MATASKLATSPWGHAIDDLRANAADRACFSAVRPVGRKNVCRRNDRSWGHCNSATYWPYYTAKYERQLAGARLELAGMKRRADRQTSMQCRTSRQLTTGKMTWVPSHLRQPGRSMGCPAWTHASMPP